MKEKLFSALKQAYSHLGLGDELLTAYSDSLVAAGIVTEENLTAVVEAQKASLEAIQKANDKRAADAKKKAEEEAAKKAEELERAEAEKKAREAAEKAKEDEEKRKAEEAKNMPEWFKAYQQSQEAKLAEEHAKHEELQKRLNEMAEAAEKAEAERVAAKRSAFIASEAKRLGVPEWRTKEGFSIAQDADEKAITEYLTSVANNVKANTLPGDSSGFPKLDDKAEQSEIDALADKLLK